MSLLGSEEKSYGDYGTGLTIHLIFINLLAQGTRDNTFEVDGWTDKH